MIFLLHGLPSNSRHYLVIGSLLSFLMPNVNSLYIFPSLNKIITNHIRQTSSEHHQEASNGGDAPPGGLTDADIDSNWDEAIDSFDGMDIPEELLRGIYAYGFEKPSAIQQRAIKPTMLGRDLIAQAQSGTVSQLMNTIGREFVYFKGTL
jgi:hypothetical protein